MTKKSAKQLDAEIAIELGASRSTGSGRRGRPRRSRQEIRSVGWALGRPEEQAMIGLLRKLAPQHPTLATLDAIARDHGFVRAGSDERLPHWSDCASHRGGECDMGADCGALP